MIVHSAGIFEGETGTFSPPAEQPLERAVYSTICGLLPDLYRH